MTTKITENNLDAIVNTFINWQSVITADGSTTTSAVAGQGYIIDTTSATHTINLPASASNGDTIVIKDYAGTFNTNNLTIGRNGHNIQGVANDSVISSNRASVTLVYIDSTKGWVYTRESNVADLQGPSFITATGGTITTSGDFKIHTFTGDGCFVVSSVGNSPTVPTGGPSNVDYLVVAGGGGGGVGVGGAPNQQGGGGGGSGGYRTSYPSPAGVTPVTTTSYPITVGAGGAGGPAGQGSSGNSSIFSTITSSGGGGGGEGGGGPGASGGSGAGGGGPGGPGGTGNTPPVSPSQGNSGGSGGPGTDKSGGGGGGASESGNTDGQKAGGDGLSNSITGSSVTYAGGGGGGGGLNNTPAGVAGDGGGGAGGAACSTGSAGTANTGGAGGGAGGGSTIAGSAGGKGIVIIRYKFQ